MCVNCVMMMMLFVMVMFDVVVDVLEVLCEVKIVCVVDGVEVDVVGDVIVCEGCVVVLFLM